MDKDKLIEPYQFAMCHDTNCADRMTCLRFRLKNAGGTEAPWGQSYEITSPRNGRTDSHMSLNMSPLECCHKFVALDRPDILRASETYPGFTELNEPELCEEIARLMRDAFGLGDPPPSNHNPDEN